MAYRSHDLDACNTSISVGMGPNPHPDPDPDRPVLSPHQTHQWGPDRGERWFACRACGVRDHWPAAERRCIVRPSRGEPIHIPEALEALRADLDAFAAWWSCRAYGALPSMDEWAANFHEWRIAR